MPNIMCHLFLVILKEKTKKSLFLFPSQPNKKRERYGSRVLNLTKDGIREHSSICSRHFVVVQLIMIKVIWRYEPAVNSFNFVSHCL